MQITADTLARIAGRKADGNMRSTIAGLAMAGVGAGLERPHRLAQFLAQLAHESGGWRWDREIWGPTAAQKRYEGRKDLGNVQPGDGSRFRGRGPIQITGRANYAEFTAWARKMHPRAPDFTATPEAVNTDPWEGLGPIWYWDTRGLNVYADRGDLLTVTKRINGGTNGLADRQARYTRTALVLLGYAPADVRAFQRSHGLSVDGKAGPRTREALHTALTRLPPVRFDAPLTEAPTIKPAPFTPHETALGAVGWFLIGVGIVLALTLFFGG